MCYFKIFRQPSIDRGEKIRSTFVRARDELPTPQNLAVLYSNRYQDGFGRFCSETYNHDNQQMDNLFMHLTNVAIQKNSDKYNQSHGGKWMLDTLKFYIESIFGYEALHKVKFLQK